MQTTTTMDNSTSNESTVKAHWASIALFLLLAFGISWAIWLGLGALDVAFTIRVSIGMFGPALAALVVRLARKEGFADAGLRLVGRGLRGGGWMYLTAYIIPPVLIASAIAVTILTGVQHWAFSENLAALARTLTNALHNRGSSLPPGMSAQQLATISLIAQTALAFSLGILFNMLFTFGEEFGWRGYLLPRLAPLGGVSAAVMTGVIWGLWHAPLIVLNGYNYPGHPWAGVGMMVVFTVAFGVILAWLRFRSGSIWPAVLCHAAFNAQAGFGVVLLSHADSLLRAPIGVIGLLPMIIFAIWLAANARLKPRQQTTVAPANHAEHPA